MLLSICAVVVAVGLGGAAQPQQQPATADQPTEATEKARQKRSPVMVTLTEADGERDSDQQQPEKDAGWADPSPWYDLVAQSLMALWALGQLILTGVGIWYIRRTLMETEKAVGEAGKATEAAQDAVAITRDAAERQLRAYVNVVSVSIKPDGNALKAEVVFVNNGTTPAVNVVTHLWLGARRGSGVTGADLVEHEIDGEKSRAVLPSGSQSGVGYRSDLREGLSADAFWAGDHVAIAYGLITYEDVFGHAHETRFCFFRDRFTRVTSTPIAAAPVGNSIT